MLARAPWWRRVQLLARAVPQAEIFEHNPLTTPEPSIVSLTSLADSADSLANADVAALNCLDAGTCVQVTPGAYLHSCEPTALASTNVDGNFTDHVYISDTHPEDSFAEVQAFYHVERGLTRAQQLGGFDGLSGDPLRVVVNYHAVDPSSASDCNATQYNGDSDLSPFDGALFAPDGDGLGVGWGDTLALGQGRNVDYAYDGDVVIHELGHAVLAQVAPDLSRGFVDEHGYNPTGAGLHEAYPDLLSLFVSDDPIMGEYVGSGLGDGSPRRDLTRTRRCPNQLEGRPHTDSLIFSTAIWRARESLDLDDPTDLYAAVFTAQQALGAFSGFTEASRLTVLEAEVGVGSAAAQALEAAFAETGADGCQGRIVDGIVARYRLFADTGQPARHLPAIVQHRFELTESAQALVFAAATFDTFSNQALIDAQVLVKAEQAIRWQESDDQWQGDHTHSAQLQVDEERAARADIVGPFEPGIYYVMLVNHGENATIYDAQIGYIPAPASDGCGCSAGQSDRRSATGFALFALALFWIRCRFRLRLHRIRR